MPSAVAEKTTQPTRRKLGKNPLAMIIITSLMIILNILSWISAGFSDFFAENIFHFISDTVSPAVGLLPFSLGEIMIGIGIALVLLIIPVVIALIITRKNKELSRRIMKLWGNIYGWVLIFILVTETMNCFIMYHTTELSYKYHGGAGAEGFTVAQLTELCEQTIINANELADQVLRDSSGKLILPDDTYSAAASAMESISGDYSMLSGKYPPAKKIGSSMLMTQFDLQGIYFPFSLEANYNPELCPARVPATICHELTHLKGFIREDEAGFLAYRACIASDEPAFRYSGYISAMNYLYSAVKKNASPDEAARLAVMISDKVHQDNRFVSDEFRKKIEEKSVIPQETASAVSDKAMETTLKLNGVSDGKRSYSRMVDLLLEYHYCILPLDTDSK
ncbi:MAG: DUF3810 domain-containing protein [Huintestinicola sp.]